MTKPVPEERVFRTASDLVRERLYGPEQVKDGSAIAKRAGIHEYCASGLCRQGKGYRERLPGYVPPGFRFYRPGSHEQRVARRTWIRSNLDVVADIDHPDRMEVARCGRVDCPP